MRVELQPAYILHTRPFSDTSLILDCLTEQYGRLSLLAKGARSPKSRQRQMCQPFRALLVSWQGKSNLKTLVDIEAQSQPLNLAGRFLYSGFYLNELIVRALREGDACPEIYQRYRLALMQLDSQAELEPLLRELELGLVADLGYGIDLRHDATTSAPLEPDSWYRLVAEQGLVYVPAEAGGDSFLGRHLLAVASADYSDVEALRQAKRLTRLLLKPIVGDKPLKSRELFVTQKGREGR